MTLEERILGCLYGGAAGDALGYAVEFMPYRDIVEKYGEEGIKDYDLRFGRGKAVASDDSQMTLFTAEGICLGAQEGRDLQESIYHAYLNWLMTQEHETPCVSMWQEQSWLLRDPVMNHPRAPGNTCLSALRSGYMGEMDRPLNNSKGCGAVMRTAPCGFAPVLPGVEPDESAMLLGAKAGAITHSHPMGWVPAAMLADMIYRMTYKPCDTLADVVRDSLDAVQRRFSTLTMQSFVKMIRYAMLMAAEKNDDLMTIRRLGGGWVGDEALAIAVYCALRHQDDLIACLRAAVNHSGDSDSTGAIAGNILGCWLGLSALPQDWRTPLDLYAPLSLTAQKLAQCARKE